MGPSKKDFEKAFTEWDLRYRNNPEEFMDTATHLLKESPYSYGKVCAEYFVQLLKDISKVEEVKSAETP
jgi:hypothetical protein